MIQGWLPYKMIQEDMVRWVFTADKKFTEPFFDESVAQCLHLPENSSHFKPVSTLDYLKIISSTRAASAPAAIIFHISRCGSTLLSQLLSEDPLNSCFSEVPFFDELLREGLREGNLEKWEGYLRETINIYAHASPSSRYFLKLDSWHTGFYESYRKLFPGIPFILLYRKPDEVWRSQRKLPGMHAVPGVIEPAVFGFQELDPLPVRMDEWLSKVLAFYFSSFIDIAGSDPLAFPLNYHHGVEHMLATVLNASAYSPEPEVLQRMYARTERHSKRPSETFREDRSTGEYPEALGEAMALYQSLVNAD